MTLTQTALFLSSAIQGTAAVFQVKDRFSKTGSKARHKQMDTGIALFLVIGFFYALTIGIWTLKHPPKQIPCQKITTGPATSISGQGGTSISHSGNGDTYNLPPASKPK